MAQKRNEEIANQDKYSQIMEINSMSKHSFVRYLAGTIEHLDV